MGNNANIQKIKVKNGKIQYPKQAHKSESKRSVSVFTENEQVPKAQKVAKPSAPTSASASASASASKASASAKNDFLSKLSRNKKFLICAAIAAPVLFLIGCEYKRAYDKKNNIEAAEEYPLTGDTAQYVQENTIENIDSLINEAGASNNNKIENIDSLLNELNKPYGSKIENFVIDYSKGSTTDVIRQINSISEANRPNKYVKPSDKKTDKKTVTKNNAENPMVVKEKEAEKAEAKVQQTVVPETVVAKTNTNAQLKSEIKEESKFIKKYVTDFIKRDLISKPAHYTETINSFIKEFGYKPNNDEIAEYVIAKKGDCVSGILIKAKEKELGRNLTGKEKAAIGELANNIQIRRKTQIKGATNDFIIAGDTIPTREVKMLFK